MANRYANLEGSKKISEDFQNINVGFDRVQAEMDTKGTPADAQAKADAAKAAAIAAAAADLAAHKARGADEHPTAKGNAAGFMSAADKSKSDASTNAATPDTLMQRDAEGRAKVAAPAAADDIARKAETDAVKTKLDSHAADTVKHVTQAEHDKLNGIAAGAEVNQNAFSKINDVSAGSKTDTVTFVGGTGITVTTNPTTKQVTVTATGEATPGAHAPSHLPGGTDVIPDAVTGGLSGLMSGVDAKFVRQDGESKTGAQAKADAAEQAANEYTDQKVGEIVIDDASLTDKGIVQLSNKTDGDSENVAATEKAVSDARQSAINGAALDSEKKYIQKSRPSNLLPNSSAEMQIQGWTNVSSVPFVSSNDVNDEVSTAFVSNGATTSTSSILKSDNISIRSGVTYTLSADFINPAGVAGQIAVGLRNADSGAIVKSISCDAGTAWHRKAITFALSAGSYYVELSIPLGLSGVNRRIRKIMFSTGTDGDLWNQDSNDRLLFQSVSDGKTAIAAAITGKDVPASGSDTFPQLATKIGQIQQGAYKSTLVNMQTEQYRIVQAGEIGGMNFIADVPANTKVLSITQGASNTVISYIKGPIANVQACYVLLDFEGRMWKVSGTSAGGSDYVYMLSSIVDLVTKSCQIFRSTVNNSSSMTLQSSSLLWTPETTAMPTGFRTDRPMQLAMAVISNSWAAQTTVYFRPGYLNIKSG